MSIIADFCVDLDLVWQFLGYSRKRNAKEALIRLNYLEGADYRVSPRSNPNLPEKIYLTVECYERFHQFCSATKTLKNRRNKESEIVERLFNELGGTKEVPATTGHIDLLTFSQIVEVKAVKCWKQGFGQVLIYGDDYPYHQKRLHLFGSKSSKVQHLIESKCLKYGVIVTWEL